MLFRCFFSVVLFLFFCCIWLQPLFNRVPWIFLFPLFVKSNLLFGYQNKFALNHNVINNICFHIKQKLDNWPKLKIVVEFLFNMKNWIKMVDKLEKENSFWWQIGAGLSTRFYWIIYEVKAKKTPTKWLPSFATKHIFRLNNRERARKKHTVIQMVYEKAVVHRWTNGN